MSLWVTYDDEYYNDYYESDERVEPVCLIMEGVSEKNLTEVMLSSGLALEEHPRYIGNMEKLVFMYGDDNEVYSPTEIKFTERIQSVWVYPDFIKNVSRGKIVCRTIVVRIEDNCDDILKDCIAFEKIINKAFDGFNLFLFIANDGIYWGCRLFDKLGKSDCALSLPIVSQSNFEQITEELSFATEYEDFNKFYNLICNTIKQDQDKVVDYEEIIRRRRGVQISYLEEVDKIGKEIGVDFSKEKLRYRSTFEISDDYAFSQLLEEVEEDLSFIKSNRVNTYEMLFEADEMMKMAEETEQRNTRLSEQRHSDTEDISEEMTKLLDDPEEMIKTLKKLRGI